MSYDFQVGRGGIPQRCPSVAYAPKPTKPVLNRFLKFVNDLLYAWSRLGL